MVSDMRRIILLIVVVFTVAGCSGNNEALIAVQDYANRVVNRPPGQIPPPPEMISYEAFTYSAANLRGPFEIPLDVDRVREPLEAFAIGTLRLRGIISRENTIWGLIQDENNNLHYVMRGSYMGRNHGRVVAISESKIDLIEIVPSGAGGWIERPQTVSSSE